MEDLLAAHLHHPVPQHKDDHHDGDQSNDNPSDQHHGSNPFLGRRRRSDPEIVGVHAIEKPEEESALTL